MSSKHTPGPWVAGRPDMKTIVDGVGSKWIYGPEDSGVGGYVAVASDLASVRVQEFARTFLTASILEAYRTHMESKHGNGRDKRL